MQIGSRLSWRLIDWAKSIDADRALHWVPGIPQIFPPFVSLILRRKNLLCSDHQRISRSVTKNDLLAY